VGHRGSGVQFVANNSKTFSHRLSGFAVFLITMSALSPALSVFVLGGEVLKLAGTGAAIAFIAGFFIAVIWSMIYAELGSAFPHAGGEYAGISRVLGPAAGFFDLVASVTAIAPAAALAAMGFATYIKFLVPDISTAPFAGLTLILVAGIAILNIRTNAIITGLFLAVEMAALLALAGAGFLEPARPLIEVLQDPVVPKGGDLISVSPDILALAAISGAYATVGGNQAISFGEEMATPHRSLGWVISAACLIGAAFIAGTMVIVVLGANDLAGILSDDAPLSAFLREKMGPAAAGVISLAVAAAIFNAILAQILASSRLVFSLARDGVGPRPLNNLLVKIHPRFQSPWTATIFLCALAIPLCFIGERALAILTSSVVVFNLGLVSLSVLVGRYRGLTGVTSFAAPLSPLAPIAGIVMALIFIVFDYRDEQSGRVSLFVYGGILAVAMAYYYLKLSRRPGGWTVTDPGI